MDSTLQVVTSRYEQAGGDRWTRRGAWVRLGAALVQRTMGSRDGAPPFHMPTEALLNVSTRVENAGPARKTRLRKLRRTRAYSHMSIGATCWTVASQSA